MPPAGIEPAHIGLKVRCSTAELRRRVLMRLYRDRLRRKGGAPSTLSASERGWGGDGRTSPAANARGGGGGDRRRGGGPAARAAVPRADRGRGDAADRPVAP